MVTIQTNSDLGKATINTSLSNEKHELDKLLELFIPRN